MVAEKSRGAQGRHRDDPTKNLPTLVSRRRFLEGEQTGFMGVRLFLLRHADDAFRHTRQDIVVSAQDIGRGQGAGEQVLFALDGNLLIV